MTSICPDNNRKPEVIWYFKLRGIKSINSVNSFFESQTKSGDDLYYSLFVHSPNITKPFSPTFLRLSKLLMFMNTLWSCMITIRRLGRAFPFWFLFLYLIQQTSGFSLVGGGGAGRVPSPITKEIVPPPYVHLLFCPQFLAVLPTSWL